MKRVSMRKSENPIGLTHFTCMMEKCDRDNCLQRCRSLDEARKDPLILDLIRQVKLIVSDRNAISGSSDNSVIEPLDRCETLERAKDDPLVLELIPKLRNEVYVKAGRMVFWDNVLEANPEIPTLLGYTMLNELGVLRDNDIRRNILREHEDAAILLFFALLNEITKAPSCEVLSGQFEAKKKASARDICQKLILKKELK